MLDNAKKYNIYIHTNIYLFVYISFSSTNHEFKNKSFIYPWTSIYSSKRGWDNKDGRNENIWQVKFKSVYPNILSSKTEAVDLAS